MYDWIARLFQDPQMLGMGHAQRLADANLGLGWVYYALARLLRPARIVVIGSYRGFAPLVFGRALHDNGEGGSLWFIDPSLADGFWSDPRAVSAHFAGYGVTNVRHFLMTTQEFVATESYRMIGPVGLLHVDGLHTEEQAEFDFDAFAPNLTPSAIALFHDSVDIGVSKLYGPERAYTRTVRRLMDRLKQRSDLQVFDLPFGAGLTLVRRAELPPADSTRRPR
jgi:predicted O-methyltransferase YrrM